jgi:hypothetical protein
MTNENDLIQKLMVSKKIMEKHNTIPRRADALPDVNTPMVESYDAPAAKYNLPQELVQESTYQPKPQQPVTQDKILSSKLPDEIKKLMIEHPISQPNNMGGPTLSNELVDKAARLMSLGSDGNGYQGKGVVKETTSQRQSQGQNILDNQNLRSLLKEVVQEVLSENGMITESVSKTNDIFSFKVGKHIFEGKVTKVKKIQ